MLTMAIVNVVGIIVCIFLAFLVFSKADFLEKESWSQVSLYALLNVIGCVLGAIVGLLLLSLMIITLTVAF